MHDEEEIIRHEDDIFTLCEAIEEYKLEIEQLQSQNRELQILNKKLADENFELLNQDEINKSNVVALENALSNILDELNSANQNLTEKENDIQSLQSCLNAVHRRKIEIDDLTKQQQSELIEKLRSEKNAIDTRDKSNKQLIAEYEEVINNKDSEILDLKCAIRVLEQEKKAFLNDFKNQSVHDQNYNTDDDSVDNKLNSFIDDNVSNRKNPLNSSSPLRLREITPMLEQRIIEEKSKMKPSKRVIPPPLGSDYIIDEQKQQRDEVITSTYASTSNTAAKSTTATLTSSPQTQRKQHSHYSQHSTRNKRRSKGKSNKAQLTSSVSDDEYRGILKGCKLRSPYRSDDDDDDVSEEVSPIELTIRRTTSAVKQSQQLQVQRERNTTQLQHDRVLPPPPPQKWEEGRKHEHLFTEAKVIRDTKTSSNTARRIDSDGERINNKDIIHSQSNNATTRHTSVNNTSATNMRKLPPSHHSSCYQDEEVKEVESEFPTSRHIGMQRSGLGMPSSQHSLHSNNNEYSNYSMNSTNNNDNNSNNYTSSGRKDYTKKTTTSNVPNNNSSRGGSDGSGIDDSHNRYKYK